MKQFIYLILFATTGFCQTKSLFDGESLDGWKTTPFVGHGQISVQNETIILGSGKTLTGITYTGEYPTNNYEITLEAKRVSGSDFFCGFTFPVKDEFCSLILGGWGGSVVGLSSIDGIDASQNATGMRFIFEDNRWYKIKILVKDNIIRAWVDKRRVVDFEIWESHLSVRSEVELSKPLGIATWKTTGAIRNISIQTKP